MQETLVAIALIGAISYMGWRFCQRSAKKPGCGPACGCDSIKHGITNSKKD